MQSPTSRLSIEETVDHTRDHSFTTGAPCRIGMELEWLTSAEDGEDAPVEPAVLRRALPAPLPAGSGVTIEPGGQLESSSQPLVGIGDACASAAAAVPDPARPRPVPVSAFVPAPDAGRLRPRRLEPGRVARAVPLGVRSWT
ncbi:MAG TPA: hypothetical protein VE760_07985 [Acidimicrobiales bacterium]|nr:hypothetical protein [Acidimicrobiales bacterium]